MLLFADGFDHYATADITKKWTLHDATITAANGRRGSPSLRLNYVSSSAKFAQKTLTPKASWIVGFSFQTSALGSTALLTWLDGGSIQCTLLLNTNGTLSVVQGNSTAVSGGTSTFALVVNQNYYIEWKVTIADVIPAGSCKVRVNGVDVITVATGADLKLSANATADGFKLGPINAQMIADYDDLYICDQSGTMNNDFLGDIRVDTLYPNADGTYSQWTPSAVNGAHRYWRLYVDALNGGGSQISLTEFGLSLTPGGVSVATGGTASASSVVLSAANAFDGNSSTWWATSASQVPGWIAYDFGAGVTKNIKGFSLTSINNATYTNTAPTRFQLQYSDDGIAWTTLATETALTWTQNETKVFSADLAGMTHAALVDEATPNLTDYNYALTPGLRDSYAFQDLPSLVSSTVYGVQANAALLKDDAGNKQVAPFVRSGGVDSDGATAALGTSQTYVSQIWETNPNGSVAWTQATVNAMEAGVKVIV